MAKGKELVYNKRYFTLFAPRQSGKSTFFMMLDEQLKTEGYKVCYTNWEYCHKDPVDSFGSLTIFVVVMFMKLILLYISLGEATTFVENDAYTTHTASERRNICLFYAHKQTNVTPLVCLHREARGLRGANIRRC